MSQGCCSIAGKTKYLVVALALIAGTALITRQVVRADDDKPPAKGGMGDMKMSAEDQAKMEAMMKPGPNHKALEPFVGEWTVDGKFWMKPGDPPQPSKATANYKWIMDGRFIQEDYNSDWMGQPFRGINIIGYNNASKQYQSIWYDSMGTGIWSSAGTMVGKTLTTEGKDVDCMTGKPCNSKAVMKIIDNNKFHMDMYKDGPDGKPFKCIEFDYTRK